MRDVLLGRGSVAREREASDRAFGLLMAAAFAVVALLPLWRGGATRSWAAVIAMGFALVALAAPRTLRRVKRAWLALGLLLQMVVSPVVLGIVFFGAVWPTGLVMRALGKDPLRLRRDADARSYWIDKDPRGPGAASLRNPY